MHRKGEKAVVHRGIHIHVVHILQLVHIQVVQVHSHSQKVQVLRSQVAGVSHNQTVLRRKMVGIRRMVVGVHRKATVVVVAAVTHSQAQVVVLHTP